MKRKKKWIKLKKLIKIISIDDAKHLWLGEPAVHRVLSEITSIVTGDLAALPLEF